MEEEISVEIDGNLSKVERMLRPLTYVSWILGVGIARPKNIPKIVTVILRIIHFMLCTVLAAFSVMDFKNFHQEFTSKIFEIMYCMNKAMCHFSSYYYVCHVILHYDKWPELMQRMESLDRKITKDLLINDRSVQIRQILAVLAVLAFGPMSLAIHVLYYYFTNPSDIYPSDLFLYYTIAQTLVNSFVFDIIVYIISHRFGSINELIKQLDETMTASWTALKIRKIRELHNEACRLVMTINDIYGVDLLFCSSNAFTMVVAKLFRIYMSAAEHKSGFIFLNNVIWMIYGGQFIIMCWVCTLTHREVKKIGILIHTFNLNVKHSTKFNNLGSFRNLRNKESTQLEIVHQSNECPQNDNTLNLNHETENQLRMNFERECVRNETNDFSSQLREHPVSFTACDFFEMNNSLLTRFVSVITTYLIIVVQFYRPQDLNI